MGAPGCQGEEELICLHALILLIPQTILKDRHDYWQVKEMVKEATAS